MPSSMVVPLVAIEKTRLETMCSSVLTPNLLLNVAKHCSIEERNGFCAERTHFIRSLYCAKGGAMPAYRATAYDKKTTQSEVDKVLL